MPTPINAPVNAKASPDATGDRVPELKPRVWLGALVVCAVGFFWGPNAMVASAVGAALGLFNLWAIGRLVTRALTLFQSDTDVPDAVRIRQAVSLTVMLTGKMGMLFVLVWAAIRLLNLAVLPLALGFSVFLLSLFVSAISFLMVGDSPQRTGNA